MVLRNRSSLVARLPEQSPLAESLLVRGASATGLLVAELLVTGLLVTGPMAASLLALAGCSAPGGGSASSAGGDGADGRVGSETVTPAEALAGLDLAHVDVLLGAGTRGGPLVRLEAVEAGVATNLTIDDRRVEWRGSVLPMRFYHDAGTRARAGASPVTVEIEGLGDLLGVAQLLETLASSDRATLAMVEGALEAPLRRASAPLPAHARALRDAAALRSRVEAVPAGAPFARDERIAAPSDAALEAFLAYCEVELLVRRPAVSVEASAAEFWFGGLVGARQGNEGAAVRGLAAELHRGFLASLDEKARGALGSEDLARLHVQDAADDWVPARLAAMREMIEQDHGPEAFRRLLRRLVDEHRGGAAIGWEELAEAAEREAPDLGARFVRAWLRSPKEPVVKVRWSYDSSRERVLMRVDQVHELRGAEVPPAYPFRLEVVLSGGDGAPMSATLEIDKRRDLFEIPAGFEPTSLELDPDGRLRALMSIRAEGAPARGNGEAPAPTPADDA